MCLLILVMWEVQCSLDTQCSYYIMSMIISLGFLNSGNELSYIFTSFLVHSNTMHCGTTWTLSDKFYKLNIHGCVAE